MKHLSRNPFVLSLGLAALLLCASSPKAQDTPRNLVDRGIVVDRIKIYSDADLRAKFRDLARQLSPLLGIDPAKILEGLFTVQGIEADRTSQAFNLTGAPLPAVETIVQKNFPTDKDPVTGKQVKTNDSEQKPNVPPSAIPPGTVPQPSSVALNSLDRISEYTQLFYETTNLQMLLNRAISDTISQKGPNARVPVILGLPVSVVAEKDQQGALAQIWVRVTPIDSETEKPIDAETGEPINVITQIPQERTYNVATVTNNVSNLGLGVVTTLLNVGFSQTRQQERSYLVKSYDTISLTSFNGGSDKDSCATFGWQIRPVLGNRNITPGKRNLMVALSLPPGADQTLKVEVFTRWYRYDKRTGNIKGALGEDDGKPAYTTKIKVNTYKLSPRATSYVLNSGQNNAIESRIVGHSFTPDLPYYSGGRRVTVSSSSDDMSNVQLSLTKDDLLTNDFRVGTIFGSLRPLQIPIGLKATDKVADFYALTAEAWEQSDDTYKVRLRIDGNWEKILEKYCIVQIGDYFPGFATKDRPTFHDRGTYTESDYITVPAKSLATNRAVILSAPFYSFHYPPPPPIVPAQTSSTPDANNPPPHDPGDPEPAVRAETTLKVYNAFSITKVVQSGKGEGAYGKYTIFTITGRGLRDLIVNTPDILERPAGSKNPDGTPKMKAVQPQTISMQLEGDLSNKPRINYFQSMFRTLNEKANQSKSGEVFLVPISDDALKFTKIFVVTKKVSDDGAPFDIDDKPNGLPVRDFTRIVTVEPKKESPPAPEIKSIDSVKLNHIGAVMVRGENLERIKKVIIGKDEVKFVGPEEVEIAGKKENVYYIVLPASIAKTAGPRTVVFVLDDDSIITGSFNVGP